MKGIHICSNLEWINVIELCKPNASDKSPYGPYFKHKFPFWEDEALVYFSGYSKEKAAGAAQYMISKFGLDQIIVAGSCGGVHEDLEPLDVVIGNETVIYDCIDRLELEAALFPEDFRTELSAAWLEGKTLPSKTYVGRIATADQDIDHTVRALLRPEGVLVADWESGAIALICQLNQVGCVVFRGVSDVPQPDLSQAEQAEQYRVNTPKLMKRIFEEYLPLV